MRNATPRLAFLFIDGDHRYETVSGDFRRFSQLVRPGGLVALHDILPDPTNPTVQVCWLWQEFQQQGYQTQEVYSSPAQGRYGIGIVRI